MGEIYQEIKGILMPQDLIPSDRLKREKELLIQLRARLKAQLERERDMRRIMRIKLRILWERMLINGYAEKLGYKTITDLIRDEVERKVNIDELETGKSLPVNTKELIIKARINYLGGIDV
jgi:hypothetical protein